MSVALFSPRLLASRFQVLNPKTYYDLPKPVRMKAIYDAAKFVGSGTALLTMAKIGGAGIELDPRSSDFGKIRIGKTRLDPWGGFVQVARLLAQVTTGERKTSSGQVVKTDGSSPYAGTRLSTIGRFAESKLNPQSGLVVDLLRGKNFAGEDMTFESEAYANLTPLYLQDLKDAMQEFGPLGGMAITVPAFYGMGVQTYTPTPPKGKNPFANPLGSGFNKPMSSPY
jgi:hypothetical protein